MRETIKIDFTTGDIITPSEIKFQYKTLLYNSILELKAYNTETILAEKIETILSRGPLNSRMRDFYDVHILWKLKEDDIDKLVLRNALINTAKYRKTYEHIFTDYLDIMISIKQNQSMKKNWGIYQKNYPFAKNISWQKLWIQ